MNLSALTPHLLYVFKSEHELIQSIEELSENFTRNRERINDYLEDPRLISAYAAFYLTTNAPKLREVLRWLPSEWVESLKSRPFIDVGAGPGTYSLAWSELALPEWTHQIEISPLMREQAARLWFAHRNTPLKQTSGWSGDPCPDAFLFFGHSANEMGPPGTLELIHKTKARNILFVEPGTSEFFPKMLLIRRALVEQGYRILYPCPGEERCPLEGSIDWCHQFIRVQQDLEIERLSQKARKDRRLLPLTVQAFSLDHQPTQRPTRVIRTFHETKFSFEWEVCEHNQKKAFQVMKRKLGKKQLDDLSHVLAGDGVDTETEKELEKSSRVQVLRINNRSFEP